MADIANLVLAVDSTAVPKATAALDGLAASGARAEVATAGLGAGFKGAGVEASAMASAAQLSARAAVDQAAGFGVATNAARVNTMALRESLVVSREIMRGNFTRLPGSLMILAQGVGSQGGIGAFVSAMSQRLGLIRQVQDAELAAAAASAATAAGAVRDAAQRAAAATVSAEAETALAEASIRSATSATEEVAARERLIAAHHQVALAAREAAVSENALAAAQAREAEAGAASAAATRTMIGGAGIGLIGLGIVAGTAYEAFKHLQTQIKDDGSLTAYRDSLGLTHKEMLRLTDGVDKVSKNIKELGPVTVTFGDVVHGVWGTIAGEVQKGAKETGDTLVKFGVDTGNTMATGFGQILLDWFAMDDGMKTDSASTFSDILGFWNTFSAAISAGFWTLGDVAKAAFAGVGQTISDALHGNITKAAGNVLALMPGMGIPGVGMSSDAISGVSKLQAQADANMKAALAQNAATGASIRNLASQSLRDRMAQQARAIKANRTPKRGRKAKAAPVDHAHDTISRLDEQILQAKIALTKDATEEAALKVQELRIQRDKTIADAQSLLNTHKITQGEFATIQLRAQELDNLKEKAVMNARDVALQKEAQAKADQLSDFATDDLKFANDNASTQAEHRRIQLQMLDVSYRKLKLDLESERTQAQINGATAEQLKLIQNRIDRLPTQQAHETANVIKSTQDPLQAWLDSVKTTAPEIKEALQSIEVQGLDNLAKGIAGVANGTQKLGQVFKSISQQIIGDIVQMTVKMLIFKAISGIFGGIGGGVGSGTLGSAGGNFSSTLGGPIPHFASGGSMIIGGNGGTDQNVMSINGEPQAMVGKGETLAVFPSGKPANDSQRGPVEIKIGFGAAPDFAPFVQEVAGSYAAQAVKVSVDHTNTTIKTLQRRSLNGGR